MNELQHIESIICIAYAKGCDLRIPYKNKTIKRSDMVQYHIDILSSLKTPDIIINQALMFINEFDTDKVWECIHRKSFLTISREILNGIRFEDIIKKK